MSDLEQRLTDALTEGAREAPPAIGLATAARSRARERRRARLAGGAALAVLAIGVPTAVVALGGDHDGDGRVGPAEQGSTAVDPNSSPNPTTAPETDWPMGGGYRWESWHDVSVRVPKNWGYGSLSDWCAGGGELTPRVQGPETPTLSILCEPASTYGVSFQAIDNHDDFQWPVVHQNGGGWPAENQVGGRGIGGVLVMAATPDGDQARFILDSMRAIGPQGDANGCFTRLTPEAANPPEGALSVCRYDETGALVQSEALVGEDAGRAVQALQAAPAPGDCADASTGSQPHVVIVMEAAGISARVDLASGCPRVTVEGDVRELTPDVLYWALSPGWSGDGTNLPLPPELRTQY